MALLPKVGQQVRFRLRAGKEIKGIVRAILTSNSGPRLKVEYGSGNFIATVNPNHLVLRPEGHPMSIGFRMKSREEIRAELARDVRAVSHWQTMVDHITEIPDLPIILAYPFVK